MQHCFTCNSVGILLTRWIAAALGPASVTRSHLCIPLRHCCMKPIQHAYMMLWMLLITVMADISKGLNLHVLLIQFSKQTFHQTLCAWLGKPCRMLQIPEFSPPVYKTAEVKSLYKLQQNGHGCEHGVMLSSGRTFTVDKWTALDHKTCMHQTRNVLPFHFI